MILFCKVTKNIFTTLKVNLKFAKFCIQIFFSCTHSAFAKTCILKLFIQHFYNVFGNGSQLILKFCTFLNKTSNLSSKAVCTTIIVCNLRTGNFYIFFERLNVGLNVIQLLCLRVKGCILFINFFLNIVYTFLN